MSHVKFEFHSNLDTLTYFTAKNRSKSFICIHGFKNYMEASDLVHTQIVSVLTLIDFCHAWAIFGPLVDKNTRKGELVELPASNTWGLSFIRIRSLPLKSFLDFFLNVLPYQLESWFIHWVGCTTYWFHVSLELGWPSVAQKVVKSAFFSWIHVMFNSPPRKNWHTNHQMKYTTQKLMSWPF